MTFLLCLSGFFAYLIFREIRTAQRVAEHFNTFNKGYFAVITALFVLCAYIPLKFYHFESTLTQKAKFISGNIKADVHCNSSIDAIFDNKLNILGHANLQTGQIVLQYGWCKHLRNYLEHPETASDYELLSLHLFTHEVMHIRGESHELKTDCQAIQRNHKVAMMLGVDKTTARNNALSFYRDVYPRMSYFSKDCAPGKEYDEQLDDAVWLTDY